MADFNINDHLQQMGFGRGAPGGKGKDGTNEESPIDPVLEEAGKNVAGLSHHLGLDLGELGRTSVFTGLETEGLAGKMISPSVIPDMGGGFLAKLLHAVFLKNREITDNTGGTGGGDGGGGGGGDYSGGGGGDFGGDFISQANFSNFESMASQGSNFDWSDISWASLGGLPRPSLPDMGPSQDIGASVA